MAVDIRKRLIGPFATRRPEILEDIILDVDIGGLLRRLLVFDTYIVESWRLAEIPHLIRFFGVDGVLSLLRSNALRIHCDVMDVGESRAAGTPANSYTIHAPWWFPDRERTIQEGVRRIDALGLPLKKVTELEEAIAHALVAPLADKAAARVQEKTANDFTAEHSGVEFGASLILSGMLKKRVEPSEVAIRTRRLALAKFEVESSISRDFGLDEEATHLVVRNALFAVARLNLRFAYMECYQALSGLREDESAVLENRLQFLAAQLDPTDKERSLSRVVKIANLPDLETVEEGFKIEKLLEVRESKECVEFREWLTTIDAISDEEIADQVLKLREKVASVLQSRSGKTLRWIVGTALGLIPLAGSVAGPAFSAFDSFVVDRFFKESGPHAFLSKHYRSLFET